MEILVVDKLVGGYIFALVFIGIVSLLLIGAVIGGIISMIQDFEWQDLLITVLFFIAAILMTFYFVAAIYTGAIVQYKAKVTDFNEVYDEGYKVVDREGELYILEKWD